MKVFLCETATEEQNRKMGMVSEVTNQQYPIGLLYLDSVLTKAGHQVLTKDYTFWTEENCLKTLEKEVRKFKPDVVGIAVMTMTRVSTYKAIKIIKSINPKIKIVLGGIHPTVMYEQLLNNFDVDIICIGEAEKSLVEILDGKKLDKIEDIAFKKKRKVIVTPQRKLNMDLDNLPFPNYDAYMNPLITQVQMTSSRGCASKCSFCCLHNISHRCWRQRSSKKVVDEIEYVAKKYPWVSTIQFIDDNFTLSNQRVIEICKEIIKRGIKLDFKCQGRIKPVSAEMFKWMEKAGFIEICFGIETGSARMLKSIHKDITPEDCIKTFKLLKDYPKIKPVKFLMVGFPGETLETVDESIETSIKLHKIIKMDFFLASPLWIYPGTEVYDYGKSKGWIDDSYWLTNKPCPYFTLEHPASWLVKMQNRIAMKLMLSQGRWYFVKRVITKLINSPKYYIKRLLNLQ